MHLEKNQRLILTLIGDLLLVSLTYYGSFLLRSWTSLGIFSDILPLYFFPYLKHFLWILLLSQVFVLYIFGLYEDLHYKNFRTSLYPALKAHLSQMLILVAFYYFKGEFGFPRSIFVMLCLLNILATPLWRGLLNKILPLYKRPMLRRVLLVGTTEAAAELIQAVKKSPQYGLQIIGIVCDNDLESKENFQDIPILGKKDEILQLCTEYKIEEIIIATSDSWQEKLIDSISRSEQTPARVRVIPSCYEILIGKMKLLRISDIPLLEIIREPSNLIYRYAKRFFDLSFALILLFLTIPISLIIMLLIKLEDNGSILYLQTRLGESGKTFRIRKFRTMHENAEAETGPVLSTANDPRITRIGKFLRSYSLDELPQLTNILQGQMSFVGPRPERPFFVEKYRQKIAGYNERFKVKPGLTGLAQINGNYATTTEIKLKYDLAYIYNQNFLLDIYILLKTLKLILTRSSEKD